MVESDSPQPTAPFHIRAATPSDAKPFRMILPDVRDAAIRLVAIADERVVAAAALTK